MLKHLQPVGLDAYMCESGCSHIYKAVDATRRNFTCPECGHNLVGKSDSSLLAASKPLIADMQRQLAGM